MLVLDVFFAYLPFWTLLALGGALFYWGLRSPLGDFVFQRYLLALATLFLVSIVIFVIMEAVPGDCATRMIAYKNTQGEVITEANIQAERELRGISGPMHERWFNWITGLVLEGDLGFSCVTRSPVAQMLDNRYFISLAICAAGLLFAYSLAIPFGVASAVILTQPWFDRDDRRSPIARVSRSFGLLAGKLFEVFLRLISYLGLALPNFLVALGIIVLYIQLGFDPPIGLQSEQFQDAPWFLETGGLNGPKIWDFLGHVWLPIFTLGWAATALQLQTVRALVVDEANKLYVTAARARGQSGAALWTNYPVRHSIGPMVNSVGFDFNRIFNDLPIVASILLLTDAGGLLLEALAFTNDQETAASILFLVTLTIVALNFLTDVALALLDPRVRQSVVRA